MSSKHLETDATPAGATDAVMAFPVASSLHLTDRIGRFWELTGIWLVSLILGACVVQMLVVSENNEIRERWKYQRYADTLRYLNAAFERNWSLGLDPVASGTALRTFDDTLARDGALYAVQMIDRDGRILLDSDRVSEGTRVPQSVIDAMTRAAGTKDVRDIKDVSGARSWTTTYAGQTMQGMAVRNAFGQTVAYTVVSYASISGEPVIMTVLTELFVYLGIALPAASMAAWLALECARMGQAVGELNAFEREHAMGMAIAKRRFRRLEWSLRDVRQAGQDQTF